MKRLLAYIIIATSCLGCVMQKQAGILVVAEDYENASIKGQYFPSLDSAVVYAVYKIYASGGSIDLSFRNYLNYKKGMKAYYVRCKSGIGKVNSRLPLINGKAQVTILNDDKTPKFEDGKPVKVLVAPANFEIIGYE